MSDFRYKDMILKDHVFTAEYLGSERFSPLTLLSLFLSLKYRIKIVFSRDLLRAGRLRTLGFQLSVNVSVISQLSVKISPQFLSYQ